MQMIQKKEYETRRPKEKEMIFGIRAVIEAIDAGKTLDKILLRRDMSSSLLRFISSSSSRKSAYFLMSKSF